MRPTFISASAIGLLAAWSSACSYKVYSPPSRLVALESARTVSAGTTAFVGRASANAAIFDPGLVVANGGVKRGVTDQLEIDGDASWGHLVYDEQESLTPDVFAGRVGVKASTTSKMFALVGGVGGGYAPAAGSFAAVDVGGIASYDNCYVIPFASGSVFLSAPVGARKVVFAHAAPSTPVLTDGFGAAAGIELPLGHQACRAGQQVPRLQLGLSMNVLHRMQAEPADSAPPMGSEFGDGSSATSYGAFGLGLGVVIPL